MSTGSKIGLVLGLLGCGIGLLVGVIASVNPMLIANVFISLNKTGNMDALLNFLPLIIFGFVAVIMVFAFMPLIKSSMQNGQKRKRLMAIGAKAMAKVISVQDTGITVNNSPFAKFVVEVKPGQTGEFSTTVSRLGIPRPGDSIEVYYDPANPSDIIPV